MKESSSTNIFKFFDRKYDHRGDRAQSSGYGK